MKHTLSSSGLRSLAVTAAFAALFALSRAQDVRIGGARTFGLGGAGVALPLDVWETHRLNPALLGFADKKLRFGIPYIGYHATNLSFSDLSKASKDIDSNSDLDRYARDFGNDIKELGLSFGNGANGGLTNSLYLTAGPDGESGGLFARIDAVPEPATIFLSCSAIALLVMRSRWKKRVKVVA